MASQAAELSKMEDKIRESEETVTSAQDQISQADERVTSYENLIKAWERISGRKLYKRGKFTCRGERGAVVGRC